MRKKRNSRLVWILILLVFAGASVFDTLRGNPHYALWSLILAVFCLLPFLLAFERQKPDVKVLVVIAVMTAMAAAGRMIFAPFPHMKPTTAIVMITGAVFGPQAGFLTGVLSALASDLFFGIGPWTPWQMLAWGLIGAITGLLYRKCTPQNLVILSGMGLMAGFFYGWILNLWTVLGFVRPFSWGAALAVYGLSLYTDTVHALATALFLFALAKPWIQKLERVKQKFGITLGRDAGKNHTESLMRSRS